MVEFSKFNNIFSIMEYFSTEEICKQTVIERRWGVGEKQDVVCPYCGRHHCNRRLDGRFCCPACNHNFSCVVGTIFENTKVPLRKWFIAMYLISSHKKGISSHQLGRDIKVCQKTAWHMLQKIRLLYGQDDTEALNGEVECDEVYIGGKEKWKHKSMRTPHTQGRSAKTKTPVFGMMERVEYTNEKGKKETMSYVRAFVVNRTDGATLVPLIKQFVQEGSHVITDELSSYGSLSREGYFHSVVCHSEEEYVSENVFTNNMEGFWSHFRRMITGCYHDISDEHLQAYVDEEVFRWNTRKMSESERFAMMFNASIGLVCRWNELWLCKAA